VVNATPQSNPSSSVRVSNPGAHARAKVLPQVAPSAASAIVQDAPGLRASDEPAAPQSTEGANGTANGSGLKPVPESPPSKTKKQPWIDFK
jgi:hypothetical protein